MYWIALTLLIVVGAGLWHAYQALRRRGVGAWLCTYARETAKRRAASRRSADPSQDTHLLLCLADHFEPGWGRPARERAGARVERWVNGYPRLFRGFHDADGRPPQHTFFYPIDEYDEAHVGAIAELCRAGFGEMEIHLHHDRDTAPALRERLLTFKELFANRHGMLARHRGTGEPAYGFIHGNWALDDSRPDGRWCGVTGELGVLRATGCYADFTLPSFPSCTQTRKINSVYYATGDPRRRKSHDWGVEVGTAGRPGEAPMLIQGPLLLNWRWRKWGLVPRVENGAIQHNQPPDMTRLELWLRAGVRVHARPDWFFVKLHTHGAPERNADVLLGTPMTAFHEGLARRARDNPRFHVHYVTAREMYNLARAAESGWSGSVRDARDFELKKNGRGAAAGAAGLEAEHA